MTRKLQAYTIDFSGVVNVVYRHTTPLEWLIFAMFFSIPTIAKIRETPEKSVVYACSLRVMSGEAVKSTTACQ